MLFKIPGQVAIQSWNFWVIWLKIWFQHLCKMLEDEAIYFDHNQQIVNNYNQIAYYTKQSQIIVVKNKLTRKFTMLLKQKLGEAIIGNNIRNKYGASSTKNGKNSSLVASHIINQIIKPKHYVNRFRINHQEMQIICNSKQYMKRIYFDDEYLNKITALTQYYKYQKYYPCNLDPQIQVIMMVYQQNINKQQRKFLKKLMNQQPSYTSMQNSSSSCNNQNRAKYNQQEEFSLKLRELDSNRSSVILKDICEEINLGLYDVKPLYYYHGFYKDGVKQFKNFIMKNKNHHFPAHKPNAKRRLAKPQTKKQKQKQQTLKSEKAVLIKQQQRRTNRIESLQKLKFQSSRQLRKTFHMVPQEHTKFIRKQNISKLKRNKTTTLKPQSFSKTTAHQTVSKDQFVQQLANKKNTTIRLRNCKSSHRRLTINQKQNITCQKQPDHNKQIKTTKDTLKQQKAKIQMNKQLKKSKSKKLIKKQQKFQPFLTKQQSKTKLPKINRTINELSKPQPPNRQSNIQNLIKTKLKLLRA